MKRFHQGRGTREVNAGADVGSNVIPCPICKKTYWNLHDHLASVHKWAREGSIYNRETK